MTFDFDAIVHVIKLKVIEIARSLDIDASGVQADDILPATGVIDSSGLMELIAWFEGAYDLHIPNEDFTIDNLGSMTQMTHYLLRCKGNL